MQIIGITGRSGCGKSTLTDSIRTAGFRCVDADQVAREVLLPGSPCIVQLQQEFGADIVDEAGQVRRRLLADRAFATPQGTARLTAITQPEIYHRLDLAMAEARQAGEKLFFVDGAVIVGTPFQKRCSHLVLVAAPYETSVQRICARDGIALEMARRRLDAQLPENVLRAAADFVIENDGTLQQMQQRCNAPVDCPAEGGLWRNVRRKISANALCWHHPRRKWLFCGCVWCCWPCCWRLSPC